MSRAPFVAMKTDLRKEDRVEVIADITGFDRDQVLGKLFRLWAWCTDRGLEDAPDDCDGYAVPERVIRQFFGERGVEALLGDDCDELAMAVRRPDGLIYLRGTDETVARLRGLRATAVAGGRAAHEQNKRDGEGRFVRNQQFIQPNHRQSTAEDRTDGPDCKEPTICPADGPAGDQLSTSRPPAASQLATSREPAASSEIPQTTDHIPESEIPAKRSRACRLAPDWEPERSDANVRAEQQAKARGVDLRVELDKLRDWAVGNGAKRADWDAVWRNWTRNARPESRRPGQQPTPLELQLERVAMLEERERQEAGS